MEILVLLLLISIFASFVIPTFMTKQKDYAKHQFITKFTTLINQSLYQAITTGKIHQIFFDLQNYTITTKVHDSSLSSESKHNQFSVSTDFANNIVQIPTQITIRNFFIQGKDEFQTGNIVTTTWFYIMPDGTSQSVIINLEDQKSDTTYDQFSLTINPFYSQVQEHNAFQKQ